LSSSFDAATDPSFSSFPKVVLSVSRLLIYPFLVQLFYLLILIFSLHHFQYYYSTQATFPSKVRRTERPRYLLTFEGEGGIPSPWVAAGRALDTILLYVTMKRSCCIYYTTKMNSRAFRNELGVLDKTEKNDRYRSTVYNII